MCPWRRRCVVVGSLLLGWESAAWSFTLYVANGTRKMREDLIDGSYSSLEQTCCGFHRGLQCRRLVGWLVGGGGLFSSAP